MTKKHPLKKGRPTLYKDTYPVDAYILAKNGGTNNTIAQALGVTQAVFEDWVTKHDALRYALQLGRGGTDGKSVTTFMEYVYNQLPEDLQKLWDKIDMWADHPNGIARTEALLSNQGIHVRQHLFVHAMVASNFNASEACRKVCIGYQTIRDWTENDPNFPKLLDAIEWHKKNFFEGSLINLVQAGNTLATVFANRTKNKDRGYNEKVEIEHSGTINHEHQFIATVDKLKLPMDTRLQIRESLRTLKMAERVAEEQSNRPALSAPVEIMPTGS